MAFNATQAKTAADTANLTKDEEIKDNIVSSIRQAARAGNYSIDLNIVMTTKGDQAITKLQNLGYSVVEQSNDGFTRLVRISWA